MPMNSTERPIIMCECRLCTEHRRIEKIRQSDDMRAMRSLIKELEDSRCELEDDLDYHKCIIDGSWPTADEIITRRRHRVGVSYQLPTKQTDTKFETVCRSLMGWSWSKAEADRLRLLIEQGTRP